MNKTSAVKVTITTRTLPTHLPAPPDKNPMFLEKRVYQGSSGKVYPLPFTDRIAETATDRAWKAVWLENEFLRVLVLPEIGGRIHAIQDKTNGYDLIYNQRVIKPALVGLAGPWISGGIEFNWPQHHRPATFLPVDFEVEKHTDGSATLWCSDHDPMARMKGMHGICLHPGKALVELKVRAYNRTPLTQTFLWWANVATRVHEAYQSFFPPDVYYVADHARRSMSEYPLARGYYYGVNYGERGRNGIPKNEAPLQFVPPHCANVGASIGAPGKLGTQSVAAANPGGRMPAATYAPNDLSFYANIPTPCSYMCMGSREDFFGGYDYAAQAGIVHVANHHISPGKKQWTWGNHEFGYAWDRNLTEKDAKGEFGPYIEIMAGVYTDNQPDFSFLQPGETKTWSQYWYPIQKIGPAQHANLNAAVSLRALERGHVRTLQKAARRADTIQLGLSVTAAYLKARITVQSIPRGKDGGVLTNATTGKAFFSATRDLRPDKPFVTEIKLPRGVAETDVLLRITDSSGNEIISYKPKPRVSGDVPPPATEPPAPTDVSSADELFITGLHLEQYRHATRCPTLYWREALRRDPQDARCNNALGLWHLRRGEFAAAESHFRNAIARLTRRNANPADGEAYYNLGLCLRYQADACRQGPPPLHEAKMVKRTPHPGPLPIGSADSADAERENRSQVPEVGSRWDGSGIQCASVSENARLLDEAYDAFYKACWNQAWMAAGYHALAEIDCRRQHWATALEHLSRSLRFNTDNLRARNLKVMVLRKLKRDAEAKQLLRETLSLDPLDWWARHLNGEKLNSDSQTALDLMHDCIRAGLFDEAAEVFAAQTQRYIEQVNTQSSGKDLPDQSLGTKPLMSYTCGWLLEKMGKPKEARKSFLNASACAADYCFPSRLEEIAVFEAAMAANPHDAKAPYYLGNLLYDRRRHMEAIRLWEQSAKLDPDFSIAWRNLGIGYFNILKNPARARTAYDRALEANPIDARLLFERDQLWKRLGETPAKRLRELEQHPQLVPQRDDLSVEYCTLLNQTGRHVEAMQLLAGRKFQPWEGGEGAALGQHVRTQLALGREALAQHDYPCAVSHFENALQSPENLGEAKHLLANQSDIRYWLGVALELSGEKKSARTHWLAAANFKGDFQEMSVRAFSEMTYYSALSLAKLGRKSAAQKLFRDLLTYAEKLARAEAKIDYFATSLPTMLLFDDDVQFRQETAALFLQVQARLGLGQQAAAKKLLAAVLKRDPNHAPATDLAAFLDL